MPPVSSKNNITEIDAAEFEAVKDPKQVRSSKDRPTGTVHFGDDDFETDNADDATWGEVYEACCKHSGQEWGMVAVGIFLIFLFLYFFLIGLELLGNGSKVMSGCSAGAMFGDDTNPIAGLMIGIIATVLLQSSSTTSSIVISLIGDTISVRQGIFMIMGANIGTSVTNTIVAIGQMGDGDMLERAFAGATVHDMFNFCTVAVLLPVEAATGLLKHLTEAMVKNYSRDKGEEWEGPITAIVNPIVSRIIIPNKAVTKAIALGKGSCEDNDGFYPIQCEPGTPTANTCSRLGLIGCDKDSNKCPVFFSADATAKDDMVSGGVCFFLAIILLFFCLGGLVTVLQKMLLGMSTRIVYKATNINGYAAMVLGAGITIIVQSSSITTSTLTPLVGLGALRLEQMLPLTLGANIGTTMTGIMAALVAGSALNMQVALAHLWFNVLGIVIFYPIPFMRQLPLSGARALGKATRVWRGFPLLYILVTFGVIPGLMLGLSSFFAQGSKGMTVLGTFIVIVLLFSLGHTAYWFIKLDGKAKMSACFELREKRRVTMEELPDDMEYIKSKINVLLKHANLPDDCTTDDDAAALEENKPLKSIQSENSDAEEGA